jgi:hypothetical protein
VPCGPSEGARAAAFFRIVSGTRAHAVRARRERRACVRAALRWHFYAAARSARVDCEVRAA